jgi:hypothetical protein
MAKQMALTFQLLDIYIAAFLILLGIHPKLELNNGRVVFVFPATDDVYKAIANYNSNVNVPVADFVTAVKSLRGQMLTLRDGRGMGK